jgi:hypothetical protein
MVRILVDTRYESALEILTSIHTQDLFSRFSPFGVVGVPI